MAGLYIHVPFCKKRCLYCDFYSNTDTTLKETYIQALVREMELRKTYLKGEELKTIYIGGGTPSLLSPLELETLFDAIYRHFRLADDMEITLEANPDDINEAYVQTLRSLTVNRISMGVQSFDEEDLRFLNRRHTRTQAIHAVKICQEAHLYNISIDLIYGLPGQTLEKWKYNLAEAIRLDIPHLSAYHLIYEEGTPLYRLLEAGRVTPVSEEASLLFFRTLIDTLSSTGYEHYEISNFARPGHYARHNSAYWQGGKYLGLGPSAHSYDGGEREWNASSLSAWVEGIRSGKLAIQQEPLDMDTRYNDYIVTRLRTKWGIRLPEITSLFGEARAAYCLRMAKKYLEQGMLILREGDTLALSREGIFISDGIMSDLLFV